MPDRSVRRGGSSWLNRSVCCAFTCNYIAYITIALSFQIHSVGWYVVWGVAVALLAAARVAKLRNPTPLRADPCSLLFCSFHFMSLNRVVLELRIRGESLAAVLRRIADPVLVASQRAARHPAAPVVWAILRPVYQFLLCALPLLYLSRLYDDAWGRGSTPKGWAWVWPNAFPCVSATATAHHSAD